MTIRNCWAESAGSPFIVGWNFYFLLKFGLFLKGAIQLDTTFNLLFLLFILMPAPAWLSARPAFRYGRTFLNAVLALALLWYDSWLPPITDAVSLLNEQGLPSFAYAITFIRGLFSMNLAVVFLVSGLVAFLARKHKGVTLVVLVFSLIMLPLVPVPLDLTGGGDDRSVQVRIPTAEAAETKDPAKYLESFYSSEAERIIMFRPPTGESPPFDIIVLNVCSFSWDDMKELGMTTESPFFRQFDYLLTNFNTATGYSGPAVTRLLQANCGQRSHGEIHKKDTPKICLLYEGLESVGYQPYVAMNHDGKYGNFNKSVRKNGLDNAVMVPLDGLDPEAVFFDGKTPLYSDYAMLKKLLEVRQSSKSERAAIYYNTVLLHAGSHWVGDKKWYGRDKRDQFKDVSEVLMKDLNKFIDLLKSSKRNTVLIFVPEHGRALTASNFQAADLRDIPLPKITTVPVGVKFIGPKFNNAEVRRQIIAKPTSYLALSWLLSKFVENSPFGVSAPSPADIELEIPKTNFVSEHEGRVVMEMDGRYLYYGKDKKWITLTPDQLK